MNTVFYALFAQQQVGVFSDWDKAKKEQVYATGQRYVKKYLSYEVANSMALQHLKIIAPNKIMPTELPLNLLVRVRDLNDLIIPFTVKES